MYICIETTSESRTVRGVPRIFTTCPWKVCGERSEEVMERPCYDNVVKEVSVKCDQDYGITYSCLHR